MAMALLRGMRWAAAPIAGALAALVVQFAVYHAVLELLDVGVRIQPGEWMWAAKAFTSLFMGAAFVAVVWWIAPAAKLRAAAVALVAVVLWGGCLIVAGLGDSGTPWLVAMGTLGILGGTGVLWIARRSLRIAG
jgi:LPXTG-motif cell wall-anchored protein